MSPKLVRPDWIPNRRRAIVCVRADRGSDVAAVRVNGELRAATAPELVRALHRVERQARLIVLDLRQLTFIDPCGVHVIVTAGVRARRTGHRLVVVREPAPDSPVFVAGAAPDFLEIVDLQPAQPAVQALLELARRDRAA